MKHAIVAGVTGLVVSLAHARDFEPYFPTLSDSPTAAAVATARRETARPAVMVTAYWENDGGPAKGIDRHDRHYTAGYGMSLSLRGEWVERCFGDLPSFGGEFDRGPDTSVAVGAVGAGQIYTPELYEREVPDFADRPYAGYLRAGVYLQRAREYRQLRPFAGGPWNQVVYDPGQWWRPEAAYEHIQVDVGVIGPSSLGQKAQEMFHSAFDYPRPRGWKHQLSDEPALQVLYVRKWRNTLLWPDQSSGLPIVQAIPEAGLSVGTVRRELAVGSTFRLAWGTPPEDFGPTRLDLPGSFTTMDPRQLSVGLFARPAVRVVEHNALVQGNTWRSSVPTPGMKPLVGELELGVTLQFLNHFAVTYSWTYKTEEFEGQRGCDRHGAIAVSVFGEF